LINPSHKPDIQTSEDIKTLIDGFYATVREDEVIGYIFNDVAKVDWPHHLPRMYAFWEFLLLGKDTYMGNPIEPHYRVHAKEPLSGDHFDRWVALFEAAVDAHFAGRVAEDAKTRARLIAMTWAPKFTGVR
jgi:hemoglobin